ncbi:alpha-aminoadipic semialdehyde synthase [Mercurialis annua]|uniref:alpha-aminoadipic semialdehyde synthase n=1 Tax=Mercurialis annua TaxID=3986 RepID=UPI00215FFD53|nr:alpha-aminoadipic semialdehyde synthase [Mercurialis annua]XP_050218218.1 alpha-aminoadipic semialdehyde synthase [Mercurialis annua]
MLGNGVVGILAESVNKWERRVPLTPSHCARLLHSGKDKTGVARIVVQPSTKRIHHDAMYEDVGCEISDDLSECGLILGIKQPKLEMILPDRAYAFFSHTHKAQKENMPLLDKILAERVSLYDYELIVGDHGKRLLAFGKYAGRAGLVDFFHGLGQRYLSLGYSTPFLSLGSSYMYSSLAAAKAAVISVGEEISTFGLPSGICPLVFIFTGSGNVSQGAQEIFKLLPHTFVEPSRLPELFAQASDPSHPLRRSKRVHQVYGCVVTSQDMVEHIDSSKTFDKADYYAHPEHYKPIFHEKIAPYASIIVNCMYWEKRFPRLLSAQQLQDLTRKGCPLVGVADITCDVEGSIEFINQITLIDSPFFRYDPLNDSYHQDMEGNGLICSSVDILPTEFAKEASQHFGDILSQFIGSLASITDINKLPSHLRRACIAQGGEVTPLFEYVTRMRNSDMEDMPEHSANSHSKKKFNILVSLSGHLFDQFLINEALDIIEAAGGAFHLAKCHVGQSADATSYSELEVGADDREVLDHIVDSLTSLANSDENQGHLNKEANKISLKVGKVHENGSKKDYDMKRKTSVLIIGAGRVCRPAAEFLASVGSISSHEWYKACLDTDFEEQNDVQVIVASLYLKDAEEIVDGIPNATAVQLDVMDHESLCKYISQVEVVVSLLPPSCHLVIANECIKLKKHLVTASYVDDSMSALDEKARAADITILGEMGLDPGIDHMMAMKMINQAHVRKGRVKSFTSYCGALPSPAAANNPLAYKFSWSPVGVIRAGRNPATYRSHGEIINVEGDKLYESAFKLRLPDLPAFALECLPNRNSLVYGKVYGIEDASTIFRGTLRYEGFGEIMGTLARIGLFSTESHSDLTSKQRPTFKKFLCQLLNIHNEILLGEKNIAEKIVALGHCKEKEAAVKAAKTIIYLGLHEQTDIPALCQSPFEVACFRMEERLTYSSEEQDMVLLHHEIEVEFPDGKCTEHHTGTLLEFGTTKNGKTITSMAVTVGIPAAIGALLLLENKIKTRGVVRPIEPEVYMPALEILQAQGIRLMEKVE